LSATKIASALAATLLLTQGIDLAPYEGPRAAPIDLPAAPPIARPAQGDPVHVPAGGELAPNSAIAGWFAAESQRVTYSLSALPAGAFAVLEVECAGFARGWSAKVGARIVDGQGNVHYDRVHGPGASFAFAVAFEAPHAGPFTLELDARVQTVRYALARHDVFAPNRPASVIGLSDERVIYGAVASARDKASFAIPLSEGERVALELHPLRQNHRDVIHARRAAAIDALRATAPGSVEDLDRAVATTAPHSPRESLPFTPWPILVASERPKAIGRQRLELSAGADGFARFDVRTRPDEPGGLFMLRIERSPQRVALAGRIGDTEDDPVAGIEVRLLLQPQLEEEARATTNAEGAFDVSVPPGEYSVLMFRPGSIERVLTRVAEPGELNLVWSGPAAGR